MKIALFVTNHYQFLTAVNIKMTLFRHNEVHLFSAIWPSQFEKMPFDKAFRIYDWEEATVYSRQLNGLADLCFFGADDYNELTSSFFKVEGDFDADTVYDQVLTHGFSYFAHWVYMRSYMKNAASKLALFGDGTIFTFYPLNYFFYKDFTSVWIDLANNGMFEAFPWFMGAELQYLYRPELVPGRIHPMIRIPPIDRNGDVRDMLNNLLGLKKEKGLFDSYDYIFFDSGGMGQVKCLENEKEMLEEICKIVGRDKVLVRQHPRSPEGFYDDTGVSIDRSTKCIEHIYLNACVSQKVLIGAITTALHTPFEIFGKHPRKAVILNRLARYNPEFPRKYAHDSVSLQSQDELVNSYCSLFPESYVIPETWDDVRKALLEDSL